MGSVSTFKRPTLLFTISLIVILLHGIVLFWLSLSFQKRIEPKALSPERLVVKTVSLKPIAPTQPPPTKLAQPKPIVQKKPKIKKPPEIKKSPSKIVKKEVKKENPPPKKSPSIDRELIARAKETIAKIQPTHHKTDAVAVLPTAKEPIMSHTELSYRDELAGRLKLLLRFPEYGEVKIKLTLDRSGSFVALAVVEAKSERNRKYLEKQLPALQFPPFGENFKSLASYTFSITLSHEF